MSYSLDDVLPPQEPPRITRNLTAWIVVGHAVPGVLFAWTGLESRSALAAALAVPHAAGLVLALVAWTRRERSLRAARASAWISALVLGLTVAFVTCMVVGLIWAMFFEDHGETGPEMLVVALPIIFAILLVGSVPTIGGFAASVSLARDLRHA